MNPSLQFFIDQEVRKVEAHISAAGMQLRAARTIRQVVQAAQVSIPSTIAFMKHQIPGLRRLALQAEDRAGELVKEQLAEVRKLPTLEERKKRIGYLRNHEWNYLRGEFPNLFVSSDREAQKLLHELKMREALPPESTAAEDGPSE